MNKVNKNSVYLIIKESYEKNLKPHMQLISKILRIIVAIVLIAYIIKKVGLERSLEPVLEANPIYILLYFLIFVGMWIIKSFKWKLLIKTFNINYDLKSSFVNTFKGYVFGAITPGRVGDFGRAYYLSKDVDLSIEKSFSTLLVEKVADLLIVISLAFVGGLYILLYLHSDFTMILGIFVAFLVLLSIPFLLKRSTIQDLLRPIHYILIPKKYTSKSSDIFHSLYDGFEYMKTDKKRATFIFLLTLIVWSASFLQTYTIALAVGIHVSFLYFILFIPIATIVTLIPISIAGIGVRDCTMIYLFSLIGVPKFQIFALSILSYLCRYSFLLGGYILLNLCSEKKKNKSG